MPDPRILEEPVELGLDLMPVIGSDLPDSKWEYSDHAANEVDGGILEGVSLRRARIGS